MTRPPSPGRRVAPLFAALVAALVVVGIVKGDDVTVPRNFVWTETPDLVICKDAPSWIRPGTPAFEKASDTLRGLGFHFSGRAIRPCLETCPYGDPSNPVLIPCNLNAVTITTRQPRVDEAHLGQCFYPQGRAALGRSEWATIGIADVLFTGEEPDAPLLPTDAYPLILSHELLHCRGGFGHAEGPKLSKSIQFSPPAGHIMHPDLHNMGWGTRGLTKEP